MSIQKSRDSAERRFRSLPSPVAKDEAYRFGSMQDWETAGKEGSSPSVAFPPEELEESALLSLSGSESRFQGRTEGFLFTELARAQSELRDVFPDDKFAQLAASRWANGAYFSVPAGVKLAEPVRVSARSSGGENHWRHLIDLGEDAEATLILEAHGDDASRLVAELVELRLAPGARLHWAILQRNGTGTCAFHRHKAVLGRDAALRLTTVHLGGGKSQIRFDAELGERASLDIHAASRGDGAQLFDFWTDVRHRGPCSRSAMEFRFVMAEKSRAVFNSLIQVERHATDSEATQKAQSLLLGRGANVHAIPKLIIQTDAVKCGHGASVATVNPEQLHYLQSRGIRRADAEHMIVRGFTEPVLSLLPTPALYARADAMLSGKKGEA